MLKKNYSMSLLFLALLAPILLLFQNCGSSSSSSGSKEQSAREAYYNANGGSGYSSVTGSSASGSGSGTFTLTDGNPTGGSGGGGTTGGTGGTGSTGEVKSDGTNCIRGEYAIDRAVYNTWRGDDFSVGQMRKFLPLIERRLVSTPGTSHTFPDELHGETTTLSCAISFEKLRKFFPSRFFSQQYDCSKNGSNFTTMQCRSGQWFVAASTCRCNFITIDRDR